MRILLFSAALVGVVGIGSVTSTEAAEVRLTGAELDRIVAGDEAEPGQSLSFAGLGSLVVRSVNVPTLLPRPVFDPDEVGELPPTVVPDLAPQLPIGLGRRDLAAAIRLILGR